MASEIQSVLSGLQQNDYASLVMITAVGYDYFLVLSDEVEYIWNKPWTWVSTLFILVRYVGLYNIITISLGEILYIINAWTFVVFLGAADFVMILRVWAMYSRSKLIFVALLALFCVEIIFYILAAAIDSDPKIVPVTTIQILDVSFCAISLTPLVWAEAATISQMIHGATMCTLAVIQFARQWLQMYRTRKQWQINQYISLLAKQGVLYFFAIFAFSLITVLASLQVLSTVTIIPFVVMAYVPLVTLTPRFIMSIRVLYARDVQSSHLEGIDSGFGLTSSYDRGAIGTAIMFADVEQNEGVEGMEEVSRDVGTSQSA